MRAFPGRNTWDEPLTSRRLPLVLCVSGVHADRGAEPERRHVRGQQRCSMAAQPRLCGLFLVDIRRARAPVDVWPCGATSSRERAARRAGARPPAEVLQVRAGSVSPVVVVSPVYLEICPFWQTTL